MKNFNSLFLLVVVIACTVGCKSRADVPTSKQNACMEACQAKQDAIDAAYDRCLDAASEVHSNQLEGCFGLAGEAKANCIQLARTIHLSAIATCKETRDADKRNTIGCYGNCFMADPGPIK